MKLATFSALSVLLVASFVCAPSMAMDHEGHEGHDMAAMPAGADAPWIDGVVKKVDPTAAKVTISHGPLSNGMPAMTMAFRVKNKAWIGQMKAGQKIRFAAADVGGSMTVVKFEAAQ